MELLHSRALLSAFRSVRSCRGIRYTSIPLILSSPHNPPYRRLFPRSLTTNATPVDALSPTTNTNNQDDRSLSLPTQVRLLMRRVPYPVAIITSTDPTQSTTHTHIDSNSESVPTSQFRGMTVSSFNTVTLTPRPVISFNVRRPSETLHALLSSGRFLVHLLATHQHTASLARDFARGNHNLALGDGQFEFVPVTPSSPVSSSVSQSSSRVVDARGGKEELEGTNSASVQPLPMLRWREDTTTTTTTTTTSESSSSSSSSELRSSLFPFVFECRLLPESVVDVYDHTIVVGMIVRAITSSGSAETETLSEDLCLSYANTRFWEIGNEVV